MKKALKYLPTFIFLAFIYVMAILFVVLPKKEYSSSEKRNLADFPTLTASTFFKGEFGEDYETYLSDHTPFRNFYVGVNSYYNLGLGNPLSNGVYHCKDGYLINDPTENTFYSRNLRLIKEYAKGSDTPVTVLLAPSTGYIENDKLPNKHIVYKDDEYFKMASDSFSDTNINFVDIRDEFKAAQKNNEQLYYKTDHHWTTNGAYIAYKKLADSLEFVANPVDNYDIESHDGFYGTTYSTSGYWLTEPDNINLYKSKNINDSSLSVHIEDYENGEVLELDSSSMYFTQRLKEDDKYPVFLDGNHAYTVIKNNDLINSGNDKKLLIIKDSFAHSLTPFFADHFSEIVMIDLRYMSSAQFYNTISQHEFTHTLFLYSVDNIATDDGLTALLK